MDLDALADRLIVPSFSRIGYLARARSFEPLARLDGRTVLVTGPTSGIGEAAAGGLADLGARLVLVGRNREKLERVAEGLAGDGHRIEVADLASIAQVGELADRLDPPTLDVVVHNAGAMFDEHAYTDEGIERTLALNLVAPWLLTERLLATGLRPDARVILVSSGGMYSARLSLRDQRTGEGFRPAMAYARAKRGQVVLVEEWARAHPDGPGFHAMHPGWADTPGVEASLPTFRTVTRPVLRTPAEGADTILWLAGADDLPSGRFWLDRRQRPTHYRPGTEAGPERRERFLAQLADLADDALTSSS